MTYRVSSVKYSAPEVFESPISSFCSKIVELIAKILTAVRNCFHSIYLWCFKNQEYPTRSLIANPPKIYDPFFNPKDNYADDLDSEESESPINDHTFLEQRRDPDLDSEEPESPINDHTFLEQRRDPDLDSEEPESPVGDEAFLERSNNADLEIEEPESPIKNKAFVQRRIANNVEGEDIVPGVDSEPKQTTSPFKKLGHHVLSKITGVKTEYAATGVNYLAGSVDAMRKGKYKVAAAAGLASLSAMIVAGTNLAIPKEVRELNKLTSYTNPYEEDL